MTVTYTINHSISSELETWLAAQPDFVSFEAQENGNKIVVVYNHADAAAQLAFKDLLAKQIGLSGENVNTSDTNILTNLTISPAVLTGDVDDWNPTGLAGASAIRVNGNNVSDIYGLAGGFDGRVITIINVDPTYSIDILSEQTSSLAANRFLFAGQADTIELEPDESITVRYDGTAQRWKPINTGIPIGTVLGHHLSNNTTWIIGNAPGVKIGNTSGSKIGFYGVTPVVQPAANADTSGATLANLEIEVNQLKATLRSLGLLAP